MKKSKHSIFLLACVALLGACSKNDSANIENGSSESYWDKHVPFTTSYNTFTLPMSTAFEAIPEERGRVSLNEASGIAHSVKNAGMLWAHNDSGNTSTLFLINEQTGEIVARYNIGGTSNIDWEDMEVSTGPVDGEAYVYIADTGDNDQKRTGYSVYRFAEPVYDAALHYGQTITLNPVLDRIQFTYPDAKYDTESLLVDPLTKDIFLVTKSGVVSHLYVMPYPQKTDEVNTAIKAGDFSFRQASAATCSFDGQKVMIKNRQEIYYWEREKDEKMVEMLSRTPVKAPYTGEIQGEAICFDNEYNYYTLSEKASAAEYPMLYKYTFKK
jgi:hypothetical protein